MEVFGKIQQMHKRSSSKMMNLIKKKVLMINKRTKKMRPTLHHRIK